MPQRVTVLDRLWTGDSLRLPLDTSPQEAMEIGAAIGQIHSHVQFAAGDFILECEKLYGEEAYQVIESMRLSEERRYQYVRVSLAFPPGSRRHELTWSHHRAVYSLPQDERDSLLELAAQNDWTRTDLDTHKRGEYEPRFRVNTRLLIEVGEAIVEDARPYENGSMTVDGYLIQRLGAVLGA